MKKINLKEVCKVFNTKELEKAFKEVKDRQDSCNHTIDFLKDYDKSKVLEVFNFCPLCGAKLKK